MNRIFLMWLMLVLGAGGGSSAFAEEGSDPTLDDAFSELEAADSDAPPEVPAELAIPETKKAFKAPWFTDNDRSLGRYIGFRLGMGGGGSLIPRYGVLSRREARVSNPPHSPYIGFELGYSPPYRKWAISLGFDFGFLPTTPTFLASPPYHLLGTATFHWQTSDQMRFGFGFNFMSFVRMAYPSGQVLIAQGYGLRFLVFRPIDWRFTKNVSLEAFFSVSADLFRSVNASLGGSSEVYEISDFIGEDKLSHIWLLMAGIQFRLPFKERRI